MSARAARRDGPEHPEPGGLVVELRRTGASLTVPGHSTVLEALTDLGVPVRSLCGSGICGSCEIEVVAAEFAAGSPPVGMVSKRGYLGVRVCVAEPGRLTRLVLDL
ncbi:2Fe-2S iron-sulfur cluster binding domain-containing protein [Nocardia puris]|nr:2Fe-2S iron-sulfur cluster binding domain-containing protein [Nocardia puris]